MEKEWYELDRSFETILENINASTVVIVGAGAKGRMLKEKLAQKKIYPKCFFDNNKLLWSREIENIPVQAFANLGNNVNYIISVESETIREQLKKQLLELGIQDSQIFDYLSNYSFWKSLKPECYQRELSVLYYQEFNKKMNWENPKTYNEKINWEKLYMNDPIRTRLSDKYLVREWIKDKIGSEYLNTLYGVWDSADEIDFGQLPESFVLKCNHGSGWNIIVKDKKELDIDKTRKQLNTWLKLNTAYMGFEMQYKDILPKIICEKYLDGVAETVYDYNIYCFGGKPKYIWCIRGSHRPGCVASFYDIEWNMQEFSYGYPKDMVEAPRPNSLDKMLELSEKLSEGFKHVRVDWYNMPDGTVIFGEMTFAAWNGLRKFEPEEWDLKFGELI